MVDTLYECRSCKEIKPVSHMKIGSKTLCKSCNSKQKVNYWSLLSSEEKRRRSAKRYGLSEEEFENLVQKHNMMCAICSTKLEIPSDMKRKSNRVCIDHNHKTGVVRGLLCAPCNSGLGMFKDSEDLLMKAREYLRKEYGK